MSITFAEYEIGNPSKAGYFRIGHVVLKTSPTDIATSRMTNNERFTVLRGRNDMVKKTGQGRFDVNVQWIALIDSTTDNEEARYLQIEDLRSVLAMFKAAPFVEVENGYIRQCLHEQDSDSSSARMGFALRQLRISTHADIVDAFEVSLTMTLFNYFPYTLDLGYLGIDGQPVDAWQSDNFKSYIKHWKTDNLDGSPGSEGENVPSLSYRDQADGALKFRWRKYVTEKIGTTVPVGTVGPANKALVNSLAQTNSPTGPVTGTKSKAGISGAGKFDALISKYAAKYDLSPAMVKAVMVSESSYNPLSIGTNFKDKAVTAGSSKVEVYNNLLRHVQTDADGGVAYVTQYTKENKVGPDFGLMQTQWDTAKKFNRSIRPVDMLNPETSILLGTQYLAQLYSQGMTDQSIYWYNTGADPKGKSNNATEQKYTSNVLNAMAKIAVAGPSTAVAAAVPSAPVKPLIPAAQASAGPAPGDALTDLQKQEIMGLVNEGYSFDHAVNDVAFFYQEQQMTLVNNATEITNEYNLFPTGISVLFVNNLAQIPLAAYTYPTYQHVGSTSAKISMVMMSKGRAGASEIEPKHAGVSILSSAHEFLESQYLKYRTSWRRVSSIHRMQAFYVENKFLNMLGLRGIMIDNIATSTIKNIADTVQVEVTAMQYENIFEASESFKINTIDSSGLKTAATLISSNTLTRLTPAEAGTVTEITAFSKGRAAGDPVVLGGFLLKIGNSTNINFNAFGNLADSGATIDQVKTMTAAYVNGGNAGYIGEYSQIKNRITAVAKAGKLSVGDLVLLQAIAAKFTADQNSLDLASIFTGEEDAIKEEEAIATSSQVATTLLSNAGTTKIQAVYDAALPMVAGADSNFAIDINTLANSPKFSAQFNSAMTPQGPGLDSRNQNHGAYRDMGLNALTQNGNDFNPGSYFFDHNAEYDTIVRNNLDLVVQSAAGAAALTNTPVNPDAYNIGITDSAFVGLNADTNSLVRMTNIPGYNMAEAFPTFKLFLIEDGAPGLIQAFDNFYSYASVLDIEILRYKDRPDMARIQITNVAGVLQHKLFNNTAQGKYEQEQYKRQFFSFAPSGDPITGHSSGILSGLTASGQPFQVDQGNTVDTQISQLLGYDLRDGAVPGTVKRMPLQYAVLQPGTKIQVRMGYKNNPDLLTPVFTGRVETVEGDEILTIEAESYLAELCELPVKDDKAFKGQVRGGMAPWHDSGDTASVVYDMLKFDNAKHFGGFKLATLSDPLISGMTWEKRVGAMVGDFSLSPTNELSRIGAAMVASYDRSGENILINHVINHLGEAKKNRLTREFFDESTGFLGLYLSFVYRIPDNTTKTIWEIIRDITRRYPEYLVLAKQYGFPFGADATLVVAHPLDWYFGRLPMIGDAERYRASTTARAEFKTWWANEGAAAWKTMLAQIDLDTNSTLVSAIPVAGSIINALSSFLRSVATPSNPDEFYSRLTNIGNSLDELTGVSTYVHHGFSSGAADGVANALADFDHILGSTMRAIESPSANSGVKAAHAELVAMRSLWEAYVQKQNPQSDDRLKPVRRFHFIDHNTIVHNGMRVNDKIYNAIRIGSDTAKAVDSIPSHYTRVLDVTDLLIDEKNNIGSSTHLRKAVQQSFLKEEMGKMYEGELILRGVPEIEPGDALILLDPSTAIVGIVETDRVLHSFNQEMGYTTTCYPRCMTGTNEVAAANVGRMLSMIMGSSLGSLHSLDREVAQMKPSTVVAGTLLATAGTVAVVEGGALLGGLALISGPPLFVMGLLVGTAILGGLLYTGYKSETANLVELFPVTRYGLPWIGGLEGYQIADFWQNINNEFQEFKNDNIYPLVDTYYYFAGAPTDTLPVQP